MISYTNFLVIKMSENTLIGLLILVLLVMLVGAGFLLEHVSDLKHEECMTALQHNQVIDSCKH